MSYYAGYSPEYRKRMYVLDAKPREFELGQRFKLGFRTVKLIQPTAKGFNFLDERTHKCIIKRHLYRSKKINHKNGLWLWLPLWLQTLELIEPEIEEPVQDLNTGNKPYK